MNQDALKQLAEDCSSRAWRLAMGLMGNAADADDLVQQSFLVAQRKQSLIPSENPWSWFARIVSLEARNMRRKKSQSALHSAEGQWPVASDLEPASMAIDKEIAAELKHHLKSLPSEEREAIVLTRISDMSYRDASIVLGLPLATLSQRVKSALATLQRRSGLKEEALCLSLLHLPFAMPQDGLASATERWLTAASEPALVSTATVIGGMVVKKAMIVVSAVVALSLGVYFWPDMSADPELSGDVVNQGETAQSDASSVRRNQVSENDEKASKKQASDPVDALPQLGRVAGFVTLSDVRTSKVKVEAILAVVLGDGRVTEHVLATDITNEKGEFDLAIPDATKEGDKKLHFTLRTEKAGLVGSTTTMLWMEQGGKLDGIELRLYRGVTFSGRVISASTGKPVAKARVFPSTSLRDAPVGLSGRGLKHAVVTNENGDFELGPIAPGLIRFYVSLKFGNEGFLTAPQPRRFGTSYPDGTHQRNIELKVRTEVVSFRAPTIKSHSFSVASGIEGEWRSYLHANRIGDQFAILGLKPESQRIQLEPLGFEPVERSIQMIAGQNLDLGEINFVAQQLLSGRVFDEQGKSLARAGLSFANGAGFLNYTGITDDDGKFELTRIPNGTWDVKVTHQDCVRWQGQVEVVDGRDVYDIVVGDGGSIRGQVTLSGKLPTVAERGADGRPYHLIVAVFEDGRRVPPYTAGVHQARSKLVPDANGEFEFKNLPKGRYTVAAAYKNRVVRRDAVLVVPGEAQVVTLDIGAGGSVDGVVTGLKKKIGTKIRLTKNAMKLQRHSDDLETVVAEDGRFSFAAVPAGTWFAKLDGETVLIGAEIESRRLDVIDGESKSIKIDVDAKSTKGIIGTVLVNGEPLLSKALLIKPGETLPVGRSQVGENGGFSIPVPKPGAYYLWFTDNLFRPTMLHRIAVEYEDGQLSREVSLQASRIAGKVEGENARAVILLRPRLEHPFGKDSAMRFATLRTSTASDGSFEFPRVVHGAYTLTVVQSNKAAVNKDIEVKGDAFYPLNAKEEGGAISVRIRKISGMHSNDGTRAAFEDLILVRILDQTGKEVKGLNVGRALRANAGAYQTIGGIPPGAYTVELSGKLIETLSFEQEVKPRDDVVKTVDLVRSAEVVLKVTNDEVTPATLGNAKITIRDTKSGELNKLDGVLMTGVKDKASLAQKELRVMPLAAGSWLLRVEVAGYRPMEVTVTTKTSERVVRKIRLQR